MNIKDIKKSDRVRLSYTNIEELAESIWEHSFIHPPCISHSGILIAGGRRCTALEYILSHYKELKESLGAPHPEIQHFIESDGMLLLNSTYSHKLTDSDSEIAKLELIENVQRKNFTWQEEILAIARIHEMQVREKALVSERWTQQQTGNLFGHAKTSVRNAVHLAAHLKDDSSPLWKCSNATEAFQLLTKEAHDESNRVLASLVKSRASQIPTNLPPSALVDIQSFVQSFDPSKFLGAPVTIQDPNSPQKVQDNIQPTPLKRDLVEESFNVASKIVHHCKAEKFLFEVLGVESVDHIITDPPYAIEMANLSQTNQGQGNIDRIADTHDVKKNMSDFPVWLEGCYRVLKPKGFCIWFCDQMQWQYLYDLAIKQGFKVQRWPLVWCKTSRCMNQRAEFNFTKATEVAMIMRKGDGRLVKAQGVNYWSGGLTLEDKAAGVDHPFIKPLDLWQHLASAVALPGATIVDPFSGVGSSTRAFMLGGWQPLVCEIDETHYSQQLSNIANTFQQLNK